MRGSDYVAGLLAVITAESEADKGRLLDALEEPHQDDNWAMPTLPHRPGRAAGVRERHAPARRRRGLHHAHERLRFLHAIWHIECSAIDLACTLALRGSGAPSAFHTDCLRVAREEVSHALLVRDLLTAREYPPGSEGVHFRLWESACACRSLGDQIVVVPRVLEARGLDVTAELLPRMHALDPAAHAVLERIYNDEIGHVAVGTRWHHWWCDQQGIAPATHLAQVIQRLVPEGALGPTGADLTGRSSAGFLPEELAIIGAH